MFLGHAAVGLAAKRLTPKTSLATLVGAAYFLDLLWPILLLLGLEEVRIDPGNTTVTPLDFVAYPYSHSLVMALVWGVVVALVVRARGRAALVVAALVVSHWVLDAVVHRPDLPLYPGGAARIGLALWQSLPATLALEIVMLANGLALYIAAQREQGTWPRRRFWIFLATLVALYLVNVFSPPPPSARALAFGALLGWAFIPWLVWVERDPPPAL